jgi:predicted ATPase
MLPFASGRSAAVAHGGQSLREQSHGESFLSLVFERFGPDGVYLLDEPEAAMSPQACPTLLQGAHARRRRASCTTCSAHDDGR